MSSLRTRLSQAVGLVVVASGLLLLPSAPAQAVTGAFISEFHYDDSTANDAGGIGEFVEVTAPAGTNLDGWSIQLVNGNGNTVYRTDDLSGVVADQVDGWGTNVLTYPATTSGGIFQNGSPDGLALLNASGAVVEFISYEGQMTATLGTPPSSVTSQDTGAAVESNSTAGDQSLQRQVDGSWTGPATNTKGAPNGYTVAGATLTATDPGDKTGTVDVAITEFQLEATNGEEPYGWTATGLPPGVEVATDGTVSGTPTTAGDYTVTATVTDNAGDSDSVDFAFHVNPIRTIAEIQGTGETSPLSGVQTTRGVVTAAYPSGGLRGFYLQTPGTGGAIDLATHDASDGIFVFQNNIPVTVTPGDYVRVTGTVGEFAGATQLTISAAGDVVELSDTVEAPTPVTTEWPDTDAEKETLEGMLFTPEGDFTVSNNFATNQFGELGLAVGDEPLIQPTQVGAPGSPAEQAQAADNAARAITLDDGSSTNFIATSSSAATCNPRPTPCLLNGNLTPPYISNEEPIRVGATGTFHDDVIFTEGGSPSAPTYRFQPVQQVVGPDNTAAPATFENTRTDAPDEALLAAEGEPVVKIASFNVLNYFTTLGDADNDNVGDGGCTAFWDRSGDGNNVNSGCDQRGAWDPEDLNRQQTKIVSAINALDADVVGLMEIENSVKLGEPADEAVQTLVAALNADAGAGTWAANPSSADLPPASEMDFITNAIIYKPAAVERTGPARALGDQSSGNNTASDEAFANAREPIAQAFTPLDGSQPFLVVINHFKSKGSAGPFEGDADSGDGQGASNESRKRQATALAEWVPTVQGDIDDVYLMGDFNSYAQEDPLRILYDAGYTNLEVASGNDEYSYSFAGLSGSLDHVLANQSGFERYTGADVWNINAVEPVAMEYSRYNYHSTDFHQDGPFRSSDHDPVVVGLGEGDNGLRDIQILATNDFHGRIKNDAASAAAGAAVLSGAVKQLRAANPNTVFAAAGDLIGASTFESFIQNDKPTIDALNEAGLEVSAVGNHELDQGYDDLINRVMAAESAENPDGGAEWEYIAANLRMKETGDPAVPATFMKTMDGVDVGFVGAVTEDLPTLVSPAGIEDLEVTDIVDSVNESAEDLKADGAELVVMLVHEGSPTAACNTMTDPNTTWGHIVTGVNDDVDAIVSGHTHLDYNCSFPVAGWAGRPVTDRPVVSAGQYGANLNQLVYTVDSESGDVLEKSQNILKLKSCTNSTSCTNYPADPAVEQIVSDAVAEAETLGAQVLGQIEAPFNRAKLSNGTTENRGGESTLGNLVAEVQRWATEAEESGAAQIAFMNPGGLRDDMVGNGSGSPRDLTYKQAAVVQPFANTLVNMDLTGAQIETVLEQQWQRDANNKVPSRPFLRLGISDGFTYTYTQKTVTETPTNGDPPYDALRGEITGMWLNGEPIEADQVYSVTANSFLASGGDNFRAFSGGTNKRDTGKVDLQAMVDYMDQHSPVPVDYSQRSVGVAFPGDAPEEYEPGDHVEFDLSSLAMSAPSDLKDTQVSVSLDDEVLGTFPVDNTIGDVVRDEYGTASVDVVVPDGTPAGTHTLWVEGNNTGTRVPVTIRTADAPTVPTTTTATADTMTWGTDGAIHVTVTPATASGDLTVTEGETTVATGTVTNGTGTVTIDGEALEPGIHTLTVRYAGDATHDPSQGTVTVEVEKAESTTSATVSPEKVKVGRGRADVDVTVTAGDITPTGTVVAIVNGEEVDSAGLSDGEATLEVGPFNRLGTKTIEVRYSGDDHVAASSDEVTVEVVKAAPRVDVGHRPGTVTAGRTEARLTVQVRAAGFTPGGFVEVQVPGQPDRRKRLDDEGDVMFQLDAFNRRGRKIVTVVYEGDDRTRSATVEHVIRVQPRT